MAEGIQARIQMCIFHQMAIIRRYLTDTPKTECGQAIKRLVVDLKTMPEKIFLQKLLDIRDRFADFLKEKNANTQFKHRTIRSAIRSLITHAPYLFAHQNYPALNIPTTSNSCEGSFAHWKAKIKIHRGLRKDRRTKMIAFLLAKT
jgi:hypothetical protein